MNLQEDETWIKSRELDDTFDDEIRERLRRRRANLLIESTHPKEQTSGESQREFMEWFERTFPTDTDLPLWVNFTAGSNLWLMATTDQAIMAKLKWAKC